ncbi:MAG: type II toxin-antitoxin system Phd/YefM family antitoxin [Candidatus Competibacteraceae bacterium]|nr:type II toxin-antitoxin system Phd/YefM family antitoxin [Candidatus Competibacteraceae bacterium]
MKYVSVTEARTQLPSLVDTPEEVVLTKQGQPVAVLLSIEEYRSTQALLNLAQQPERWTEILAAHSRVQSGALDEFVEFDELEVESDVPTVRQHTV